MKTIKLYPGEPFITLGQLLKHEGLIQTGGEAKHYLANTKVWVNSELENRRGKKLHEGDRIKIGDSFEFIIEAP
ncbi:RNA-binding S4 domain-containing protein [Sporolactobacillus sp. CPB3-1]|uniref:RNA-binding S4 domain-containing protein n=1 Tax=Sporolactobacillus mangiferae TaxID=2940498 RepID=A0ABT0MD27_9BACL|nr:RNA-binding S4 domain-containing protein [Sporolactobacillus mangiferae]MCL1632215.1 RNA-binding S4 domain-containing protein [Sporolactobacillus mangiferae]